MMKDLVLLWGVWKGYYEQNVPLVLRNVQGQRYVFGSEYPGGKEGEKFFFCGNEGIRVDSTHCTITVDKHGQFWIQNNTTKFKTFVNSERLFMEPHLLGIGDTVFLEDAEIRYGYPRRRHPFFHVKEMVVPGSAEIEEAGSDNDSEGERLEGGADSDSPLYNPLILEKIMSYLPVRDLKNARLVCKKWKAEATKPLEKKGLASFALDHNYLIQANSTRVFRYLHEMRDMKMQNLRIDLRLWFNRFKRNKNTTPSPREPGQKMIGDLRKLLKSSHPLFSNSLEHFTSDCDTADADPYLKEFLEHSLPKLNGLALKDATCEWTISSTLLELLQTPLKFLDIMYCGGRDSDCTELDSEELELFEKLLLKHSKSLKHLVIRSCGSCIHKETEVSFPSFPKLEELELEYDRKTRIRWGHESRLDYEDHFPSLRKLTVRPLQPWSEDDHVFNTFFPDKGELRCETVKELWVPVNQDQPKFYCDCCDWPPVSLESFQPRMDLIRTMFPSAGNINFFRFR